MVGERRDVEKKWREGGVGGYTIAGASASTYLPLFLLGRLTAQAEDGLQTVDHIQVPHIDHRSHVAHRSVIACQRSAQGSEGTRRGQRGHAGDTPGAEWTRQGHAGDRGITQGSEVKRQGRRGQAGVRGNKLGVIDGHTGGQRGVMPGSNGDTQGVKGRNAQVRELPGLGVVQNSQYIWVSTCTAEHHMSYAGKLDIFVDGKGGRKACGTEGRVAQLPSALWQ